MTFEIYKLEWILSRHTFGNTTDVTSDEFLKNFLQLLHCLFPNLVDFKESFP